MAALLMALSILTTQAPEAAERSQAWPKAGLAAAIESQKNTRARDKKARAILARFTKMLRAETSHELRVFAAQRIGRLKSQSVRVTNRQINALESGLKDTHPSVRAVSAKALGQQKASSALSKLRSLARNDPDRSVRRSAKSAVEQIRITDKARRADLRLKSRTKRLRRMHRASRAASVPTGFTSSKPGANTAFRIGRVSYFDREGSSSQTPLAMETAAKRLLRQRLQTTDLSAATLGRFRIDMVVERFAAPSARSKAEIRFVARTLVTEAPNGHLRHTSQATASAPGQTLLKPALERDLLEQAVIRAVAEVLTLITQT